MVCVVSQLHILVNPPSHILLPRLLLTNIEWYEFVFLFRFAVDSCLNYLCPLGILRCESISDGIFQNQNVLPDLSDPARGIRLRNLLVNFTIVALSGNTF